MMHGNAGGAARPAGGLSSAPRTVGVKVPLGNTMGGGGGDKKKKMVIRPFKVQPKLPENFEDTTWDKLKVS